MSFYILTIYFPATQTFTVDYLLFYNFIVYSVFVLVSAVAGECVCVVAINYFNIL